MKEEKEAVVLPTYCSFQASRPHTSGIGRVEGRSQVRELVLVPGNQVHL